MVACKIFRYINKPICKKFISSLFRFNITINNFMIWIFLTSDLFVKILPMLFVILFVNNYVAEQVHGIVNIAMSSLFVLFVLVSEFCCFKYLLSRNNVHSNDNGFNNNLFIVKYFIVGTFTISFYFLLLVGLKYISKMIDKNEFVKYQKFRIVLSVFFVVMVFLLQIVLNRYTISPAFSILYFFILLLQMGSFVFVNKVILKNVV